MEYLVIGKGKIPGPELKAVVEEITTSDPRASFNLHIGIHDNVSKEIVNDSGAADVFWYGPESEVLEIDRVLLLNDDSNPDSVWDTIEEVAPPARVFILNEQMLELLPPGQDEPPPMPTDEEIQEDEALAALSTEVEDAKPAITEAIADELFEPLAMSSKNDATEALRGKLIDALSSVQAALDALDRA